MAVRDVVERQFGAWDVAQQDEFFDKDWTRRRFEVIEYDGRRCGYVCVERGPDVVRLQEIDIDPAFQGRGIGSMIVRSVIDLARSLGLPAVLETLHENRAADLYRRLGFLETGVSDTHTQFRLDP